MLYHTAICVHDVERAARFYDAVLAVLGCGRIWDLLPEAVAYGETRGEIWIQSPRHQNAPDVSRGCHYAFAAKDEDTVRAFYAAALAAGATAESAPAAHPEYSPDYYGAIFNDPDGNKVEVVVYPRHR
jgi:catechol 2,3-dioxygenase-like lactoylglutathione lyase family enzyme